MPRGARRQRITRELKFNEKLVLNQFLLIQFGAKQFDTKAFKTLSANLKSPELEMIDDEGMTGFYTKLVAQIGNHCTMSLEKLAQYDLNIVAHLRRINDKRENKIQLKYFQYLALLFTEYYLDEYFNNRENLLKQLNEYVSEFNEKFPQDTIKEYTEGDLNKIAYWSATGSGKTIIMHVNYYQYLYYSKQIFTGQG